MLNKHINKKISFLGDMLSHIFTSGYSDTLMLYGVNQETIHFSDAWKVEPNFSFGHVSQTYQSIYFVHEVSEYNGTLHSGAVSRWKINLRPPRIDDEEIYQETMKEEPITKQEVRYTFVELNEIKESQK